MVKNSFLYRLLLGIILIFFLPGVACNFPFRADTSGQGNDLQYTLTALATAHLEDETPYPAGGVDTSYQDGTATQAAVSPKIITQQPEPPQLDADGEAYTYLAMPGDSLQGVAKRFGVEPGQIASTDLLTESGFIPPGQVLVIPNELDGIRHTEILLPDTEVINSPSARDFDIEGFISGAGGFLGQHNELVKGSWLSGAEIVTKVSLENSINPRILLALLELRSGWVYGELDDPEQLDYPIGFYVPDYQGLYYELVLTATHLGVGYYGWRSGEKTSLTFQDGDWLRQAPGINPGTAALQTILSKFMTREEWRETLYAEHGFIELYRAMFGDPWQRAGLYGAHIPEDLTQPGLYLPFPAGERWSFTGGPHRSWNAGSPRGALDFSPVTGEPACTTSRAWVTAAAEGVVTRVEDNVLAIDLDGDGHEQTGWVLVYLHIVTEENALHGSYIPADTPLGHPSCERGNSTGTHIHLARKFNGEWIAAGNPLPFNLSGWQSQMGERNYQGTLQKGERTISANPGGPSSSLIIRED